MLKAYKYRLYPTEEQKTLMGKHFGCCRFVYNYFLRASIDYYEKTKSESEDGKGKSLYRKEMSKQLTQMKKTDEFAFLKEVSSVSLIWSLIDLEDAYKNFFRRVKQGGTPGFPKFKKKGEKQSFRNHQHNAVDFDKGLFYTPKFREGIPCVFHRQFSEQNQIKSCIVSKTKTEKYFVSILVEDFAEVPLKKPILQKTAIGVDLGIRHFAIFSNGEKIANPRFAEEEERLLRRLHKKLSRTKPGSKRREKARKRLAKLNERIAERRKYFLHNLSTKILEEYDTVCIEKLNIKSMMQNSRLAGQISDAGWYSFREMLIYKAKERGKNVVETDKFFASSKTCSECGFVHKKLNLKRKTWRCPKCDTVHDIDINAGKNLKQEVFRILEEIEAELKIGA